MKKLRTQMWNERRMNVGLWIELLVVSVVLWFIVDSLYTTLRTYYEPMGFDIQDTYQISMNPIPPSSPNYTELTATGEYRNVQSLLINFLENHPLVQAVGHAERGIHYSGGSEGGMIKFADLESEYLKYLIVTPGYLEVFRMEGRKGEKPSEMATRLTERTFLAGANALQNDPSLDLYNFLNKPFRLTHNFEDSLVLILSGVLQPFRLNEFLSASSVAGIVRMLPEKLALERPHIYICLNSGNRDIVARTQHEIEAFLRHNNVLITDFIPVEKFRQNQLRDSVNELRTYFVIAGFLLLNVFLGLLGTFWYRTQQWYGEIALHIVMGSTRKQVFIRLCSKGFLLLLFATLPALCMDYVISSHDLTLTLGETGYTGFHFLVTTGITLVGMALMILTGIAIPARRVMKMRPVEALHSE